MQMLVQQDSFVAPALNRLQANDVQKKSKKEATETLEHYEPVLAGEASASLSKLCCSASASLINEDTETENKEDEADLTVILTIILKEPLFHQKEVKEFRKDTKQQLLEI